MNVTHHPDDSTMLAYAAGSLEVARFVKGNIGDLDSSVHHRPTVSGSETCICLIATDESLQFSGILSR